MNKLIVKAGIMLIINCYYYENKPAVASCAKCDVNLCKSCREEAAYEMDGKTICLNRSRPIE